MRNAVQKCRKCGRPVCVITWGVYRKVLVDAAPVMVVPDLGGDVYVRIDGSKLIAREADYEVVDYEPAYRPHKGTCGVAE